MTPPATNAGVIAVDVGGTTLKGVAFRGDVGIAARITVPTFSVNGNASEGLQALVAQLADALRQDGCTLAGIGIASPGLVDSAAGTVRYAANLGWSERALVADLQTAFDVPVMLEHDARAAALAERAIRADDSFSDFVFVPIGTGVAAAVVAGGHVVHGASGAAGEFGHVRAVVDGRPCACGQRGCIEAYASGASILSRYREAGGQLDSTAAVVLATGTDPIAAKVWAEALDALAIGIAGLVAVLDPAAIVLGGGVARAGEALRAPLEEDVRERLGWRVPPPILLSELGTQAGLVGAGILATRDTVEPARFARLALAGLRASTPGRSLATEGTV